MTEPKIASYDYEAGRRQGWHEAIEALRDRATASHMTFADAALYLEGYWEIFLTPATEEENPSA